MPKNYQSPQTARTIQSSLRSGEAKGSGISQGGIYDPQTISVMTAAYDMACVTFPGANPSISDRETVAKRILQASSSGVSNVGMLCSKGLGSIHPPIPISDRAAQICKFEVERPDRFNRRLPIRR
jgi:hypothetical protein